MINYNSPSALKAFLDQEGLGMQKKFGQNFLINPKIRQSLVEALDASYGCEVWEIGSGIGAMTSLLLEKKMKVKAFEIDLGFIRVLKNIFSDDINFSLVEGDVMKTWPMQTPPEFLLGNLPYNLAAALLADFIEKGRVFRRMTVTVQKEVALRMAAAAGSADYSSFSVLCASVYNVKQLMLIKRDSFYPQPNVDSMGVLLEYKFSCPQNQAQLQKHIQYPEIFYPLVRALFASRRKTIKNNLNIFLSSSIGNYFYIESKITGKNSSVIQEMCAAVLKENSIKENERAENLEFDAFLSLAKSIENMRLYKK